MELASKGGLSVLRSAALTRHVFFAQISTTVLRVPQLVDTKSVNNTTLLHFLERTVAKQFPDMLAFLDELEKPAEAYRGRRVA